MLLLGWARPRASLIAITFSAVCGGGEMVPPRRCVTIDVFAVKQDESLKVALDGVRAFATAHDGVVVVHRAPDVSDADREQLRRIAARSGFDPAHPRACQCSRLAGASRLASTEPKRLADDWRRSSRDGRPLVPPVRVAATAPHRPPQPPRSTSLSGTLPIRPRSACRSSQSSWALSTDSTRARCGCSCCCWPCWRTSETASVSRSRRFPASGFSSPAAAGSNSSAASRSWGSDSCCF